MNIFENVARGRAHTGLLEPTCRGLGQGATRGRRRRRCRRNSAPAKCKFYRGSRAARQPEQHLARAKPKRARVKKVARKRARPVKPPSTTAVETVVVDVIEEPVTGVITVTEFEETEVREPSESPEQPEETPPESEER